MDPTDSHAHRTRAQMRDQLWAALATPNGDLAWPTEWPQGPGDIAVGILTLERAALRILTNALYGDQRHSVASEWAAEAYQDWLSRV